MSTDVIESNTDSMSPRGVAGHPNRAGKGGQDEKPFLFLRLPAEIRNTIYHELLAWRHSQCEDNRLHEQPAITRVNRQLRAEALPLYYASSVVLHVKAESPENWVLLIQRVVEDFTAGTGRPLGSSTLHLLGGIQLDFFLTRVGYHIQIDLVADPDDLKGRAPGHPCGRMTVGSTTLNWADATALRAPCDEAVVQLGYNLMENIIGRERFRRRPFPLLDRFGQRAALDALRAFASACPHLTHALVRVNVPAIAKKNKNRWPTIRRQLNDLHQNHDRGSC